MGKEPGAQEEPRTATITVRHLPGDTIVVQVDGELSGDGAAAMQRTVGDQLSSAPAQLIVDLSAVTSIDTIGVNALISAAGIAGEDDISFCLIDPGGNPIAAALGEAEMTDLFEVFATIFDALQAHSPPLEE